jgi:ion channel-forming bestrophin family protein
MKIPMIQYDPHRWLDHLFDVRGTLVLEIGGRVGLCVLWASGVVAVHYYVAPVGTSVLLHSLVGVALGLLLVFRTNASYDRYWEGRRLWGGIVNETRNLIRGASVHLADDTPLLRALVRWTAIFPWSVMSTLRGEENLGPAAQELTPADFSTVQSAQHAPLWIAQRMTACLQTARRRGLITDIIQTSLDANIQQLIDYVGGCERIRKTPLPFAYVVHLRRALIIYCFTLPFALVESFGWFTILDVLFVAYTFFGIEEIGVEIEGPFGNDENDLPMQDICETIHNNLYALGGIMQSEREAMPEGL